MLAVICAFVLGVGAGVLYMRFRGASTETAPPVGPSLLGLGRDERSPAPNRKARKVGLTEADFVPSDDILERLRLVEAGELDPSALAAEDGEQAHNPTPEPPAPTTPDPAAMTDAERRVLDRLRRMAGEEPSTD